jgi:hypothetical protein
VHSSSNCQITCSLGSINSALIPNFDLNSPLWQRLKI